MPYAAVNDTLLKKRIITNRPFWMYQQQLWGELRAACSLRLPTDKCEITAASETHSALICFSTYVSFYRVPTTTGITSTHKYKHTPSTDTHTHSLYTSYRFICMTMGCIEHVLSNKTLQLISPACMLKYQSLFLKAHFW